MAELRDEIGKRHDFDSSSEEAYLNLIRTTSVLEAEFTALFRSCGLSESSYNVLRILRSAGRDGRTCGQIQAHMVVRSDVTRLVDRLVGEGLVERARDEHDRRVVVCRITRQGRALVDRLDEPIAALHEAQLGHMSDSELKALSRLLERARSRPARSTT